MEPLPHLSYAVPVYFVLDELAKGKTIKDISQSTPGLSEEAIVTTLEWLADQFREGCSEKFRQAVDQFANEFTRRKGIEALAKAIKNQFGKRRKAKGAAVACRSG